MAKKRGGTRASRPSAPAELHMQLFEPGMTILHRAGLGGLACTLKYIERAYRAGALLDDEVPGGPWPDDRPPWEMDDRGITLHFGSPDGAAEYLKRLFAIGFDIRDGVIYLPGQYPDLPPELGIRVALQDGLLRSFYDHGPKARGVGDQKQYVIEVDGQMATFSFPVVQWYKHQRDGASIAYDSLHGGAALTRMLSPGATQRHKFAATALKDPAFRLLPLLFAPVGTIALRAGGRQLTVGKRKVFKPGAVVVIPDVESLISAINFIPALVPATIFEAKVASLGDAALRAEVRLRAAQAIESLAIPSIRAVWCCATEWMSKLQPPCQILRVDAVELCEQTIDTYRIALQECPPAIKSVSETSEQPDQVKWFWADSIVRPFVADNLAHRRSWYAGFVRLMTMNDPVRRKPLRKFLVFEKKGLNAMTEKIPWEEPGEPTVVRAVHDAMRRRFGQIAADNKGKPAAMKNRWRAEYDRWRLAFAGSKTADQMRRMLCDLFSRAGVNPVLQTGWQALLPMLDDSHWEKTRDLALLGLASYNGKGADDVEAPLDSNEDPLDERNEA